MGSSDRGGVAEKSQSEGGTVLACRSSCSHTESHRNARDASEGRSTLAVWPLNWRSSRRCPVRLENTVWGCSRITWHRERDPRGTGMQTEELRR